jgi:serine/threonine protein kinase
MSVVVKREGDGGGAAAAPVVRGAAGPAVNEPRIGTKARYKQLSFLGQGTYGEVFKIEDVVTKVQYADKKIKLGDREQAKEGVNRAAYAEILTLRELTHVNVLKLLDVYGAFDPPPCLVLQTLTQKQRQDQWHTQSCIGLH